MFSESTDEDEEKIQRETLGMQLDVREVMIRIHASNQTLEHGDDSESKRAPKSELLVDQRRQTYE
jgi:hypothetical protein